MKKPERLKRGDTIAVISPSWGGPSFFPAVFERGLENLRRMGLNIEEYPTARTDADILHRHPEMRAADINRAFADKAVKGIITSIGGDDSARVLKYLDRDTITANPKLFMGYSDTTGYTSYLNTLGLVTFNGPAVMAGFSQLEAFGDAYGEYLDNFLFGTWHSMELPVFSSYSSGYPPWSSGEAGKVNPFSSDGGMTWLQGDRSVSGILWGGCIEVLEMLKGTRFWPDEDFWNGRILFFETSDEVPPVDYVRFWLRNYGVMGVFDRIQGILFGRARDYSDDQKKKLDEAILSVVRGEFGRGELNIVTNVSFGHTDPQIILPLGIGLEINPRRKSLKLTESPFI